MPSIGPLELAIVLVIILLIFGPKRLPGLGKQLGTGMREFKDSVTGKDKDDDDARPQITAASAEDQPAPAAPAEPVAQPAGREDEQPRSGA
jgi:sec-independent protein translocase protein TatA